ncbi:hypothetical protein MLD38_037619 [Melastoma candidum]|uniref:Uncharacterized protein n=1 Tax=Melastoma candidum TaxID=119954 RepID=A0ACB9LP08_9MYRT|nr:hypothetical protein MLD38_037619 [Melastoma candidum]
MGAHHRGEGHVLDCAGETTGSQEARADMLRTNHTRSNQDHIDHDEDHDAPAPIKLENLEEFCIQEGTMRTLQELDMRDCTKVRKITGVKNVSELKQIKLARVNVDFASGTNRTPRAVRPLLYVGS